MYDESANPRRKPRKPQPPDRRSRQPALKPAAARRPRRRGPGGVPSSATARPGNLPHRRNGLEVALGAPLRHPDDHKTIGLTVDPRRARDEPHTQRNQDAPRPSSFRELLAGLPDRYASYTSTADSSEFVHASERSSERQENISLEKKRKGLQNSPRHAHPATRKKSHRSGSLANERARSRHRLCQ